MTGSTRNWLEKVVSLKRFAVQCGLETVVVGGRSLFGVLPIFIDDSMFFSADRETAPEKEGQAANYLAAVNCTRD